MKSAAAALVTLAYLAMSGPVLADELPTPGDYRVVSANQEYVFVMLAHSGGNWQGYQQSGLYKNDGSYTPLWTVSGYWYSGDVEVSSDGHHLVWLAEAGHDDSIVISFYVDGSAIRSYRLRDLVANTSGVAETVSGFHWKKKVVLDDASSRLVVDTQACERYSFDLSSGQIVERGVMRILATPGRASHLDGNTCDPASIAQLPLDATPVPSATLSATGEPAAPGASGAAYSNSHANRYQAVLFFSLAAACAGAVGAVTWLVTKQRP